MFALLWKDLVSVMQMWWELDLDASRTDAAPKGWTRTTMNRHTRVVGPLCNVYVYFAPSGESGKKKRGL